MDMTQRMDAGTHRHKYSMHGQGDKGTGDGILLLGVTIGWEGCVDLKGLAGCSWGNPGVGGSLAAEVPSGSGLGTGGEVRVSSEFTATVPLVPDDD